MFLSLLGPHAKKEKGARHPEGSQYIVIEQMECRESSLHTVPPLALLIVSLNEREVMTWRPSHCEAQSLTVLAQAWVESKVEVSSPFLWIKGSVVGDLCPQWASISLAARRGSLLATGMIAI